MKKVLSVILCLTMVLSMGSIVFADDGTKTLEVTLPVEDTYSWTVPADSIDGDELTLGAKGTTVTKLLSVTDAHLKEDEYLNFSVSSEQYRDGWKLVSGMDEMDYSITINTTQLVNNDTVLEVESGITSSAINMKFDITGTSKYAGDYKDNLVFTAAIKNYSPYTVTDESYGDAVTFDGQNYFIIGVDTEAKTVELLRQTIPADGVTSKNYGTTTSYLDSAAHAYMMKYYDAMSAGAKAAIVPHTLTTEDLGGLTPVEPIENIPVYSISLAKAGTLDVNTIRKAKIDDLVPFIAAARTSNVQKDGIGMYWTCTGSEENDKAIYYVYYQGNFGRDMCTNGFYIGLRPAMTIDYTKATLKTKVAEAN